GRNYSDLEPSRKILATSGKSRKPPEPTRAPRRVATHHDARAACSAPRVLVPAGGRGGCLALSVGSLAWSLRYFLRPPCSPAFGIAPSPVANIPTEAAGNEERRFHSET